MPQSSPHAFFTSYARADNAEKRWLHAVVVDLSDRVSARLGVGLEDRDKVCFFDEDDIRTGAVWEERLAEAVSQALVLVCFCSPSFFNRSHCAKEFDVFRRRLAGTGARGRVVLPVIWEPVDPLPAVVAAFQYDHADLPLRYRQFGLRKLKELRRRADLDATVDVLALSIVEMVRTEDPLPALHPLPTFDELADVFDNPGSERPDLDVVVLHPDQAQWCIAPFGQTIRELLELEFRTDRWTWRQIDPATWLASEEVAGADLLIVADSGQFGDPVADAVLQRVLADGGSRTHVLVGMRGDDPGPLATPWAFSADPPSPRQFAKKLQELLATLRMRNATADAPHRTIIDDDVSRLAEARGVDLTRQPAIQGPGGT